MDEVENLMEAGRAHVVFPRQDWIETLEGREGAGEATKEAGLLWRKPMRGEAKASTVVLDGLGEGEGQESIGLVAG